MTEITLSQTAQEFVKLSKSNGVLTIMMNRPQKLNGWTLPMMNAIKESLALAASVEGIKAVILTGCGNYYSAGVDLGGSLKLMHPRKLRQQIIEHNQALFDTFIKFPKPILVAVNGHALGASVTSATLCDAIIAVDSATFSTPFAKLGVPPEGCSSIQFERMMGKANAERMLGKEGWKPTAKEALEINLIQSISNEHDLLVDAQKMAEEWVENSRDRQYLASSARDELLATNAIESVALADAFLGKKFLDGQVTFFKSKGKMVPALVFWIISSLRPLWSRLL